MRRALGGRMLFAEPHSSGGSTMSIESRQTVAEVATSHPGTVRVFQRLGIDFCCGGKATLVDACAKKGLDIDAVLENLRSSLEPVDGPPTGTLQELITYIVE